MSYSSDVSRGFLQATLNAESAKLLFGATSDGINQYRANLYHHLIASLESTYPTLKALLAEDLWTELAKEYTQCDARSHWDLNLYGQDLSSFLSSVLDPASSDIFYDAARLDGAVQKALFIKTDPPLQAQDLVKISPDLLGSLILTPQDTSFLLRSKHPIVSIWKAVQQALPFTLTGQGETALVSQGAGGGLLIKTLSDCDAAFTEHLINGANLDKALTAAFAIDPDFDFEKAFASQFQGNLWRAYQTVGLE
jgi:Putative DNA-binding domain